GGGWGGPWGVAWRRVPPQHGAAAYRECSLLRGVHGSPVHCGDPAALGIDDLGRPDFGDPVDAEADDIPVFWACGVTPQAAVTASRPPFAITHAPGQMFISDARDEQFRVA
ncbi:D-glutamate cyclase family protein, partial [Streptomyces sp. NPDC127079]|uniref:D-glutamate cyclase family protein n=1 Tax=Streptomyces sp. NPDC127079 TaxID=3347132 RepID=UPI0036656FBC